MPRQQIKIENLPANLEVAKRRTKPIVRHWAFNGNFPLSDLAESCYLQGVNDALEMLEKTAPEATAAFYKCLEVIRKQEGT